MKNNSKLGQYGLRFSGHGSSFIPENPICNLSFDEAMRQAIEWELKADTIGGRAEMIDSDGNQIEIVAP